MFKKYLTLFLSLLAGQTAFADLAHRTVPMFNPQRLQLGLEIQSFRAGSNFLDNGIKQSLPSDHRFLTYDMVLGSMYDLSDEWAISGDLGLAYAESYSNSDLRVSRKIKDLKLGVYRLYDTKNLGRFIIDGFYLFNFVDNKAVNDEASVGDGISWMQLGVWWEPRKTTASIGSKKDDQYIDNYGKVSAFHGIVRTYVGFRTRPNFSDVLIYKIHPQIAYKKYLFGAELNGMVSVVNEGESGRVSKEVFNSEFNASSFRYNAWNPHVLEAVLWGGYQLRPYTQMRVGLSQVLGLENTAAGTGIFFDIQTSMTVTPSGMFFSDVFSDFKKLNPKRNNVELKNLGPAPKQEKKVVPSDLQDL